VRLHRVTVALEALPVAKRGVEAERDGPVRAVGRRRLEEALLPLVESLGIRKRRHIPRFLLTPLDPRQLFLRSNFRRLLDTWFWKGSVVNFVRDWGRELPPSTSRHFEPIVVINFRGPGGRLLACPTCEQLPVTTGVSEE